MKKWKYAIVICMQSPIVGCNDSQLSQLKKQVKQAQITSPSFSYDVLDGCQFSCSQTFGAEISQATSGRQSGPVEVIYKREGKPRQAPPHGDVVPRKITECRVFKDYIFGKTVIPPDEEKLPNEKSSVWAPNYDGWFFFDIPQRKCWQIADEKEYNEILDKYNISVEDRVLRPTMTQDRSDWSFPFTPL